MVREAKSFSVLLIKQASEDSHFLQKSLERSRDFPAHLESAANIEEAFSKLKSNPYHLLLIEGDGEEETSRTLEKLNENRPRLPFVLLLPIKDDKLLREAIRAGVADVIVKSEYQFHELAKKLRQSCEPYYLRDEKRKKFEDYWKQDFPHPNGNHEASVSVRDELTGLYSHGYLYERVVREFSRATRHGYPISSLMIDLDGFKKINDAHGHFAGEKVLKESADLLFENCRMSDFIARYSGKQFCMVLPHSGYEGAKELAHRIQDIFQKHIFKLDDKTEAQITISIGISAFPEDVMTQRGELITHSSEALLQAKSMGNNRISLFKELMPVVLEDLPSLHISEDKVAAFQRRMTEINGGFRRAYMDASKALIMALEGKDKFTAGHSASTAKYSFWVAQAMGMSRDEAEGVRHGGLLHDVGKICIPDSILLKPGRLTLVEFESMKQHAYFGYKMLKPIKFMQDEAQIVLHHHEWFNGEGYPCRLKGQEIPVGARIVAVVDSYDTIRGAGGRYKKALGVEEALNELIACSGTQFDPEVVKALISVLKTRGELHSNHINLDHLDAMIKAIKVKPEAA